MQLPDHSKNVFLYLCFFLQELLLHSGENQLDGKTLGTYDLRESKHDLYLFNIMSSYHI